MGGPVRGLAPSALGPPLVLVSPLGALHCPRECPRGSGATGHSKADLRLSAGSRSWGPRWTQSGMA